MIMAVLIIFPVILQTVINRPLKPYLSAKTTLLKQYNLFTEYYLQLTANRNITFTTQSIEKR